MLPVINQIPQTDEMGDFRLELLKLLVEVSPHVTEEHAKEYIDNVFHKLLVSFQIFASNLQYFQLLSPCSLSGV